MLRNIWWIAWNNVRRTAGTRRGLLTAFVVPVLAIAVAVGLFGRSSEEPARVAFVSADAGAFGGMIADALDDEPLYRIERAASATREEARRLVDEGEADAAVYVPETFTDSALAGTPEPIDLYREREQLWSAALQLEAEAEVRRLAGLAAAARGYAERSGGPDAAADAFAKLEAARAGVSFETEEKRVAADLTGGFMVVVGLMVMFVMVIANQAVHNVVADRSGGTMARAYAAPVRAIEIAAGNFFGCVLLGFAQIAFILLLVRYALGFGFGAPFGGVLLVMTAFLLAAVGISTAVASFVRKPVQLGQINNLILAPSCMIGGVFWPVGMMPEPMQKMAAFTPQRWAIKAIEDLKADGTIESIGLHLGILLLFAAVLLAFGAYVLRPAAGRG